MNQPAPNPVPRLVGLLLACVGTLSLAFVLPHPPPREAAIRMSLPADVSFWSSSLGGRGTPVGLMPGDGYQHWKAQPLPVSKAENEMLADDTEFEKKNYVLTDPSSSTPLTSGWHSVQASIVLSGHDLNDSIHRPERCLPAQGFKELKLSRLSIPTPLGDVPVSRITCYHEQADPATGKPIPGKNGEPLRIRQVFYYWFVGSHSLTSGHYERTFEDMKDRLLGGFDQRWAYVLLGGEVTDDLVAAHVLPGDRGYPGYPRGRSEEETDALLVKLVEAISSETIEWGQVRR